MDAAMTTRWARAVCLIACAATAADFPPCDWSNWRMIVLRLVFYVLALALALVAVGPNMRGKAPR